MDIRNILDLRNKNSYTLYELDKMKKYKIKSWNLYLK